MSVASREVGKMKYLISFRTLKAVCGEVRRNYEFHKDGCTHGGHEVKSLFTLDPETKRRYMYHKCCEKECPVLALCEKRGGG